MRYFVTLVSRLLNRLEFYLWPFVLLGMRLWMARVFLKPGIHKVKSWDKTLSLFKFEYKVPIIDPEVAAYLTTTFELICPVLLILGLMTRLATLPLIVMTAVIQFTYLSLEIHLYWAFLLCTLFLKGAGPYSLDELIYRRAKVRIKVMGV